MHTLKNMYRRFQQLRCSEQLLCGIILSAAIISILPVLWIGLYNVPCADDYTYGAGTHHTWEQTGSIWEVFCAALRSTRGWYQAWQGTFSAIILMCLQPAIYGESYYKLVTFLLVGLLAIGEVFFSWVVFRRYFKSTCSQFLMIAAVWFVMSVQLAPSAVEAFYWYNGGIYYTGFFSLMLIFFGVLLLSIQSKSRCAHISQVTLSCFIGFVLGGSNYVTALISVLVVALSVVLLIFLRNPRWKTILLPFFFTLAALIVSGIAPGNQVRQNALQSIPPLEAVKLSIITAAGAIGSNLDLLHILCFSFCGIILWKIAKNTTFRFPYPVFVGLLSFGIFAAHYCPPFFSMNTIGPGRLQNIVYDTYVFLIMFNIFYVLGWIQQHILLQHDAERTSSYSSLALATMALCISLCCAYVPRNTPMTATRALQSLRSGAAAQYYSEFQDRLTILKDPQVQDAVFTSYSQRPYVLFFTDISEDPQFWSNLAMADYYHKQSVSVSAK